jgi:hypothetical protein
VVTPEKKILLSGSLKAKAKKAWFSARKEVDSVLK